MEEEGGWGLVRAELHHEVLRMRALTSRFVNGGTDSTYSKHRTNNLCLDLVKLLKPPLLSPVCPQFQLKTPSTYCDSIRKENIQEVTGIR